MSDFPKGWANVTLGDTLITVIGGGTPARNIPEYFEGNIPWFTVKDMKLLKPSDAKEHISETAIVKSATNLIPANTLIVATRIALGRAIRPTVDCAINQDLKALLFGRGINSDFMLYWVGANERVIQDLGSGTTVSGIRLEALHSLPLWLPPTAEQTRIVAKLEELLSDLDAGVAELKAAQKKLKQYRQSLLKAAVEGALTAEWRAKNTPSETGAQLLERILTERRARWEAKQLAKFEEQGKKPPKDWQKKYPEPVQPDTTGLPELPEGWVWASVDQLLADIETGKSFKCEERPPHNHEVGVVKVSAVSWGDYNEQESKTCHDESMIRPELFVNVGDFLFSRANTIELVGACVIAKIVTKHVMLSDKILRLVLVDEELKIWLLTLLRSELGRKYIERLASGNQDSMRNIGQERLRQIPVPLPCSYEITRASELLSESTLAAKEQTQAIEIALKQSTAQRQNILRAAFSGQFVPQDPNDEPDRKSVV